MDFCLLQKNMGTKLSSKYGQKLLNSAKKSTTDAIKTASKSAIQITSVSKKSSAQLRSQNNEENDESETPKERYISPEKYNKLLTN